jgi:eukaryotic-like serine/threonine-protein kinase
MPRPRGSGARLSAARPAAARSRSRIHQVEQTSWGRINELFEAARRLPADEREAWVRAATTDEHVRSEVLTMLHAHEDDPWYIDEPGGRRTPARLTPAQGWPGTPAPSSTPAAPTPAGRARPRLASEPQAGGQFGTYRLIREIARDEARTIFEAVSSGGGTRPRVALHVLAFDAHDPVFLSVLKAEGSVLAHLDHPGIPRLLDGGVTPDGTAYLAFEYAAGDPIDSWCRERGLSVRERVELVLSVCDAVEHAHQHLVAHGNLRPANVLVSADAGVKVLDCGMAAIAGTGSAPGGADAPVHQSMSPEQARGDIVTTASDVYALGILLYTLLTGYPPYELGGQTPARARRMIGEFEPDVPSAVAAGRDRRALSGTLDRILMKALRKDPRGRYGTAAALAADLRAWRDRRPASVSPATFLARMTGGGRSTGIRAGVTAAALIALIAGAGTLAWQAYVLRGERNQDRVRLGMQAAEGYRSLARLQSDNAGAGPAAAGSAAASLATAAAAAEQALAAEPTSVKVLVVLAGAYGDLVALGDRRGDSEAAGKANARLRALVDQLARDFPHDISARAAAATGYARLAASLEAEGDAAAAKAMYSSAAAAFDGLASEGRLPEDRRAEHARVERRLGAFALQDGGLDEAERLLLAAQTLDAEDAASRPHDLALRLDRAEAASGLAMVARRRGDLPKAEALWTQALSAFQSGADEVPPSARALDGVAGVRASLGSLCRSQRRFEESLAHYREALRAREGLAAAHGAAPGAETALAVARTDVARLLLDLVEVRQPGPANGVRLREAGALLAQAWPAARNAASPSPAQSDAAAEVDRQAARLRRLTGEPR